jgi:phage tail-like protein
MPAQTPHPSHHFRVEAGFTRIGFTRVHLPRLARDVIRYREGSDPSDSVRLLPGLLSYGECVLERGVIPPDNEFFRWLNEARVGQAERRDVTVSLLNASHEPVMVWRLHNTFPAGLEWSVLDAQSSSILIETLHLAVEAVSVETA